MMAYAIIFDLDGTLADTMDDLKTAMNGMLTKLGYKNRSKAELIGFINRGAREFVRRSLPEAVQQEPIIVESALNIYEQEYEKCYCEKTRAYDGMQEALLGLKAEKFKLAVLSNKQDTFVKEIVEKLFGDKLFDIVMGQSNFPHKPDPTGASFIATELGVKSSRCIFVGDSDVDMFTAENADMESIGVCWGYRNIELLKNAGANHIADKPSDIVEIAKGVVLRHQMEKKERKMRKKSKSSKKTKAEKSPILNQPDNNQPSENQLNENKPSEIQPKENQPMVEEPTVK